MKETNNEKCPYCGVNWAIGVFSNMSDIETSANITLGCPNCNNVFRYSRDKRTDAYCLEERISALETENKRLKADNIRLLHALKKRNTRL